MESEKVKEIKKALEERTQHNPINCSHSEYVEACGMYCGCHRKFVVDMGSKNGETCKDCNKFTATDEGKEYADILTLINELESECESLKKDNELLRNAKVVYENVDYCYEDLKKAEDRIAELEKENDDYYERCVILRRENEQLKTLVGSLEKKNIDLEEYIKGNEQDAKAFVNGWHKDLETELKQFAERLKSKDCSVPVHKGFILIEDHAIDEILKEFCQETQQKEREND